MDGKPPPLTKVLLLGIALLTFGFLLWTWNAESDEAAKPAQVAVRVLSPNNDTLFFANPVSLAPEDAHVLGALLGAARVGNFTVNVSYGYGSGAFVIGIDGYQNAGRCGWVWLLNERYGDRAADLAPVKDGDSVVWRWGCD